MRTMLPVLAVAAVLSTAMLSACDRSEARAAAAAPPAPAVTVATVIDRPMHSWREFTGRLAAVDSVDLHPRVSGYVERVDFTEGARVHKGQLLFEIDARPFRAVVDQLTAERDRSAAQLKLAQANRERAEKLLAQNAISREEADSMSTDAATAASDLAARTAALKAAQLNLEFTQVRAPIDGRISRALITAGNLVTPDSLLTTLVSDNPVYAYFDVDEDTYLRYAALGKNHHDDQANPVYMGLVDEQGYPHQGRLDFVDNRVDPGSGTIRGRAVFDNPDGRYTPGLFARLRLLSADSRDTILIEERAIGTDLGRKYVLVMKPDKTLEYRTVKLGQAIGGLRIVEDGLKAGDVVVLNGLQHVKPGITVQPTQVDMKADAPALAQLITDQPTPQLAQNAAATVAR